MHRSGKDGLLIEIGKYGLTKRDLIAPVNLFSKVSVDAQGRFAFVPDHAKAGDFVELRFDMDVILAMSTAPHGLDTAPAYAPEKGGPAGLALRRRARQRCVPRLPPRERARPAQHRHAVPVRSPR